MLTPQESLLVWKVCGNWTDAFLGFYPPDGVCFSLVYQPTCYRRGVWKLFIDVGNKGEAWGCFDAQDQPTRYYHSKENALSEAELIAQVLWHDRLKHMRSSQEVKQALAG